MEVFDSNAQEKEDFNRNLEIKILDAFFLATTDPNKYKSTVMQAMPIFARVLMPKIDTSTLELLSGLVILFQSESDMQGKEIAIKLISKAFGSDPNLIRGIIALAKGDWIGLECLAGKICEFDDKTIIKFTHLLKKMRIVTEGEEEA